jgi:hypothetical protein
MSETIARPIVNGKFWVIKQDEKKIGSVEKDNKGYFVTTQQGNARFKTIKSLRDVTKIDFEDGKERIKYPENQVNNFPTDCKPFNGVYNIHTRLPIYTKEKKSKSWYAAGYYMLTIGRKTKIVFCPKLILLERYGYVGPVKEADGFYYK